jgi:CheY-like chemotaxis protein
VADEILVVDSTPEIAELVRDTLADEGFDARAAVARAADAIELVRESRPDVLALGLPPDGKAADAALDGLRTDAVGREIPIVAMSAVPTLSEAALASYTVRETLEEPFDIDDLVVAVERALAEPPIQALVGPGAPEGALARAEPLVAEHARAVLRGWAARRRGEEPWAGRPDASTAEVLDRTPDVLDAIDASMRLPEPAVLFDDPTVAARLGQRAARRREQDVPLENAVGELVSLRDDLWSTLAANLPADLQDGDEARVRQCLDDVLERVVALTVPAYEGNAPG